MKKLDIIIPVYKAHKTINRLLTSISCFNNLQDISVTLVNDCCPEGNYQINIEAFKPFMDIKEIRTPKNGGPGIARQYGLEHTSCPFIAFADADDEYTGVDHLSNMIETLKNDKENRPYILSYFIQEHGENKGLHEIETVWVFAKIYRRSFLDKYHICFPSLRANEDTAFNRLIKAHFAQEKYPNAPRELIYSAPTYIWHDRKDSITRINDCQYTYDQSPCGWTDSTIYVIDESEKFCIEPKIIIEFILGGFLGLYQCYLECFKRPEYREQTWFYFKKYYNRIENYLQLMDMNRLEEECIEHAKSFLTDTKVNYSIDLISPQFILKQLKNDNFNADELAQIFANLPEASKLNNINTGVCAKDYYV